MRRQAWFRAALVVEVLVASLLLDINPAFSFGRNSILVIMATLGAIISLVWVNFIVLAVSVRPSLFSRPSMESPPMTSTILGFITSEAAKWWPAALLLALMVEKVPRVQAIDSLISRFILVPAFVVLPVAAVFYRRHAVYVRILLPVALLVSLSGILKAFRLI